ncbi:aminoacyl-tRNA hydrolase [Hyunsoonleella sp. SJ7]|uniref:Aminoacyl-tRNA hydrolase n=1 Tax=Hyunsoonleella aquatilis TaxID=2762758 RepID=A0A923HBU3_9FLAO|nr:alternative ribosome rescue aminoacyl-tRNA hydrolase ArfB [Hyunsoonleella aquatilis]MBC3758216.1 aminoacyl-tRNA hydrolase [Hyunsoonleella aquatilis]
MFDDEDLIKELSFKGIKSSGSGGQHINKTASKVELTFNLLESLVLNTEEKELLQERLQSKLTKDGVLILQCGESRSQHRNKEIVIHRFLELIRINLEKEKERVPTKIPKSVVRKRLKNKQKQSEKKANRKRPDLD